MSTSSDYFSRLAQENIHSGRNGQPNVGTDTFTCNYILPFFQSALLRRLTEADFVNTLRVLHTMISNGTSTEDYSHVATGAFHGLVSEIFNQFSVEKEALNLQVKDLTVEKEALNLQINDLTVAKERLALDLHLRFSDEKDALNLQIKDLNVAKERLVVEKDNITAMNVHLQALQTGPGCTMSSSSMYHAFLRVLASD
jgi:hypothetical protein